MYVPLIVICRFKKNEEGRVYFEYKMWSTDKEWLTDDDLFVFKEVNGKDSLPTGKPPLLKNDVKKTVETTVNTFSDFTTCTEGQSGSYYTGQAGGVLDEKKQIDEKFD